MSPYHIPQYLDEPFRLILWTLDECLALLLPFGLGMFALNSPLLGLMVGGGLWYGVRRLKGEQGHYFLYQWAYWHLPPLMRFRRTPPAWQREWIG